jgi:hypothetical protein
MGGVAFRELVARRRAEGDQWPNLGDSDEDWKSFCREFERVYPDTPAAQFWPKKICRFQQRDQGIGCVPGRKLGQAGGRLVRQKPSRSCAYVEQNLFHDSYGSRALEDDFAPPRGPVVVRMEELIQLSVQKRSKPKLVERRIQIPGKRMPKFIPPVRKSAEQKLEQRKNEIEETKEHDRELLRKMGPTTRENQVAESGKEDQARGKVQVNGDTRCKSRGLEEREEGTQVPVDEEVGEDFFKQLWSCTEETRKVPQIYSYPVIVWIRRDLFERRKFGERDCFPFKEGDIAGEVRSLSLRSECWGGGGGGGNLQDLGWRRSA